MFDKLSLLHVVVFKILHFQSNPKRLSKWPFGRFALSSEQLHYGWVLK
jgi:hypothetical protein